MSFNWATLAEAHAKAGIIEEGLDAIGEGLHTIRRTGERFWEAEVHRLHGELLQVGEKPD